MTQVTPGDVARQQRKSALERALGSVAPPVAEVETVFDHFHKKTDDAHAAALLTVAVTLRIDPEEEP